VDSLLAEGYSKRDLYKVKDMSTGQWVRGHQRLNHLLDQVTLSPLYPLAYYLLMPLVSGVKVVSGGKVSITPLLIYPLAYSLLSRSYQGLRSYQALRSPSPLNLLVPCSSLRAHRRRLRRTTSSGLRAAPAS
jgi:hypothetical protein